MPNIEPGARFGQLEVIGVDGNGRRVTCRCQCSRLVVVAADALRDGVRRSCGCAESSPSEQAEARARASELRSRVLFSIAGKP
jgi:hypothetical protein